MLRVVLALVRIHQPDLTRLRIPNNSDKRRLLRAIDRARGVLGLGRMLRAIGLSHSRLERVAARSAGMRAQRHLFLPRLLSSSTDSRGGHHDRSHAYVAGLSPRPNRQARRTRAAPPQGLRL